MLRKILPPVAMAAGAFFLMSNDPVHADVIDGDGGDNNLIGTGGNDTINAGAGEDFVEGNRGDDTVDGGSGNDEITGDGVPCDFSDPTCGGADTINGGDGDDTIFGDDNFCQAGIFDGAVAAAAGECAGDDTLDGGNGDDLVIGDNNACQLGANSESTTVETCGGDDTINGGEGDDILVGDLDDDLFWSPRECEGRTAADLEADDACAGDDTINGGAGDDLLVGDSSYGGPVVGQEDFYCGPTFDPSFAGCVGDDILNGGAGDDILFGDDFSFFIGGEGFCNSSDVFFATAFAAAIDDPGFFEELFPGGDDRLSGGDGDDEACGGNGDDVVTGDAGRDIVLGDLITSDIGFFEGFEDIDDLLDFLAQLDDDELTQFLIDMYFFDIDLGGGEDDVSGGAGIDVVLGNGGHDVVCGDAEDPLVAGGGGSDVPCPVVEGTFDATSGTKTLDLSVGVRQLDDEFLEVNESGTANPWEIVILVAPTKGTLTIVGTVVTYTANAGATGTDFYDYAIRRRVVTCPGDITVDSVVLDLCEDNPRAGATALVTVSGTTFVQSGSKRITLTLAAPVVPPAPAPAPVPPAAAQPAAVQQALPVTGGGDLGLALAGLGLVALGAVVTAESKRRRNQLA